MADNNREIAQRKIDLDADGVSYRLIRSNGNTMLLSLRPEAKTNINQAWRGYNFLILGPADEQLANYETLLKYCESANVSDISLLSNTHYRINKCKNKSSSVVNKVAPDR